MTTAATAKIRTLKIKLNEARLLRDKWCEEYRKARNERDSSDELVARYCLKPMEWEEKEKRQSYEMAFARYTAKVARHKP